MKESQQDDTDLGTVENHAEQLDATVLGNEGEPGLPGVNTINGSGPMHSEDPALLMGGSETRDDMRTREWRENDDDATAAGETGSDAAVRLVEPLEAVGADTTATIDGEATSIAEVSAVPEQADPTPPAEVAALSIDADPEAVAGSGEFDYPNDGSLERASQENDR